jgi:uncharacterized membrane protein
VRLVVQLLVMVFYPLVVHLLIKLNLSWLAVTGLVITSAIYVLLVINVQRRTGAHPGWIALYLFLTAVGSWSLYAGNVYALFFPAVIINLVLGATFAATLRPQNVPVVEWFARLEYDGNPPPPRLARFARNATWAWAVYYSGFALLALVLAVTAPLEVWSLVVNVLHYVFAITLLFVQYLYRSLRLPEYGVRMPWHTLRAMARFPWPGRGTPLAGTGPLPK